MLYTPLIRNAGFKKLVKFIYKHLFIWTRISFGYTRARSNKSDNYKLISARMGQTSQHTIFERQQTDNNHSGIF